jgi:hypothetical protein
MMERLIVFCFSDCLRRLKNKLIFRNEAISIARLIKLA